MVKQKGKRATKLTAILLSLMMVVVFVPTFAFADAAADITVFMTVSDEGEIAETNDGDLMAWKEVTVKDIDEDGHFTFDEALVAAHEQYNSADGYKVKSSGWVDMLWGETSNAGLSFIKNDTRTDLVTTAEISAGDYLVASVNQDDDLYADYYTGFTEKTKTVTAGKEFTLTLQGFLAMTQDQAEPAADLDIYIHDGEDFIDTEETTDAEGKVTLSIDEPGTYVVTADGDVEHLIQNIGDDDGGLWKLMKVERDADDRPIYGQMDWTTGDTTVAYTEEDYGDGPYPWDEVLYEPIELGEFDPDEFDLGYFIYVPDVINDCPIIAPACVVTVEPSDEYVASLAKDKQAVIDGLTQVDFSQLSEGDQMNAVMTLIASIAKVNAAKTKEELAKAVESAVVSIKAVTTKIEGFSAKKGKKKATLKWTKDPENTFDGYQIYYKKAKAKAETLVEVADPETTSVVITKLSKKKKYTFKVRGYKTVDDQPVYGAWSAAKTIKIK